MEYIVIEIPHQMPPRAWFAASAEVVIARVNADRDFSRYPAPSADDLEDASDYLGIALHSSALLTESEAREFVENYSGHRTYEARAAVRAELDMFFHRSKLDWEAE